MKKLRPKYAVQRQSESGGLIGERMLATDPNNIDSSFVLMPRKDPAAFLALIQYSRFCEEDLAAEIRDWLYKIAEAEPAYGTQGVRNWTHARTKLIEDSVQV